MGPRSRLRSVGLAEPSISRPLWIGYKVPDNQRKALCSTCAICSHSRCSSTYGPGLGWTLTQPMDQEASPLSLEWPPGSFLKMTLSVAGPSVTTPSLLSTFRSPALIWSEHHQQPGCPSQAGSFRGHLPALADHSGQACRGPQADRRALTLPVSQGHGQARGHLEAQSL